jgi:hypothetical protein
MFVSLFSDSKNSDYYSCCGFLQDRSAVGITTTSTFMSIFIFDVHLYIGLVTICKSCICVGEVTQEP